jgi:hypothetical protein
MRLWGCACAVAVSMASATALAGQRPFSFGYDTAVVPEGDVELEQWLWARGGTEWNDPKLPLQPDHPWERVRLFYAWLSPVWGYGEHLELAVPFQLVDDQHGTNLDFFSLDARWRIKPRTNDDAFQMLVRAAFVQTVVSYGPPRVETDVVASYGSRKTVHATVDLGVQVDWPTLEGSGMDFWVGTYDVGLAVPLLDGEVQLGAESFGQIALDTRPGYRGETLGLPWKYSYPQLFALPQIYVGPDVAWTWGRSWFTAGCGIGLNTKSALWMPRVIWAVAF